MHDLIDGPLQEGRVDGDDGTHPARGEPRGKADHMSFGYADVNETRGKSIGKSRQSRAVLHTRSERDDSLVALRNLDHRVTEGIAPSAAGGRCARNLVWTDAVIPGRVLLGRRIAPALLRDDMDDNGAHLLARGG